MFKISDNAMEVLISFIKAFLLITAKILQIAKLNSFTAKLPSSLYLARKLIGTQEDSFTKFVTCPTCHKIYNINDCKEKQVNGKEVSKKCNHVEFPFHPMARFRRPCGSTLMKSVRCSNGTEHLYPRNIYCYQSLITSLQHLLKQPDFVENCQKWMSQKSASNLYRDVYDGELWKQFQVYDGVPFLSIPHNFAFILNVDWFQPFQHTQYSLGAIYLAILNLPREIRYLRQNIILLGVIPGPSEPKKHINSFLSSMVEELQQLWQGVVMKAHNDNAIVVRGALLCVACDIPAARKVSGFVGSSALHGCSRCLLEFPTDKFGEKPDYSNFDRTQWPSSYIRCTSANVN